MLTIESFEENLSLGPEYDYQTCIMSDTMDSIEAGQLGTIDQVLKHAIGKNIPFEIGLTLICTTVPVRDKLTHWEGLRDHLKSEAEKIYDPLALKRLFVGLD